MFQTLPTPFVIMFTVHINIQGVLCFCLFILAAWARAELELNEEFLEGQEDYGQRWWVWGRMD